MLGMEQRFIDPFCLLGGMTLVAGLGGHDDRTLVTLRDLGRPVHDEAAGSVPGWSGGGNHGS
jgi:hypothetical protein